MNVLVISCSLNPGSRSAILAEQAVAHLHSHRADPRLLDLRGQDIPLCDGDQAHHHDSAAPIREQIQAAQAILLAVPVYNFYANAAAKNLIELTGRAWSDKLVGFLCAAGGHGSYMSVMSLANSLMLDFRCLIVPRFVYATDADFDADNHPHPPVAQRIDHLCRETTRLAAALCATQR